MKVYLIAKEIDSKLFGLVNNFVRTNKIGIISKYINLALFIHMNQIIQIHKEGNILFRY